MASSCSCAARTILSAFALSQLTRRLTALRMSFCIFACMMPIAASGAPIVVSTSSMASDCLKYVMYPPLRTASLGAKPISSMRLNASRLTLGWLVSSSRW